MKTNSLKQIKVQLKAILILAFIFTCVESYAQSFNSPMDHAQSLGKSKADIAVGWHQYWAGYDGSSGKIRDNLSLRLGYGLGENIDVQMRYERMRLEDGFNYVSITPKFSFANDAFAFFLPIGLVFGRGDQTGVISPTMMYTHRSGQKFEGSLSVGSPIYTEDNDFILDINAGFGFSSDLDIWALRPEVGIHFKPEGSSSIFEASYIWHFGVAFSTNIN